MKKTNKGITLIALVITIIVLLILAGVTIMQLTQNKMLEQAEQVKIESEIAREKEQIKIAVMAAILEDYQKITLAELTKQLNPYTDIESVEGINTLPTGAELIAKEKNKVDLRNLLMPISYAAEETYEYAKITYKSGRIYYVKLTNGNVGSIYKDPDIDPSDPSDPSETYADYFTYAYMSGQDTYEEEPDKDAFSENLWNNLKYYSSETGEVDEENGTTITGYIITGFSEKGIQAFVEREWTDIAIPREYNNGTIQANVVAIEGNAFNSEYDGYTYGEESRAFSYSDTFTIPNTIKYFEFASLSCVFKRGANVMFEEGIEHIQSYAFGFDANWYGPYVYLPDSLLEFRDLDNLYSGAIYRFGQNTYPAIKTSGVCFYAGSLEQLQKLTKPSYYDDYELLNITYVYCIGDGKRVKYIMDPGDYGEGDNGYWKEITEEDNIYQSLDSYAYIENTAAEKFNFTIE